MQYCIKEGQLRSIVAKLFKDNTQKSLKRKEEKNYKLKHETFTNIITNVCFVT